MFVFCQSAELYSRNIETLRKPQWAKKCLLYYWLTLHFVHFRETGDFVVRGIDGGLPWEYYMTDAAATIHIDQKRAVCHVMSYFLMRDLNKLMPYVEVWLKGVKLGLPCPC